MRRLSPVAEKATKKQKYEIRIGKFECCSNPQCKNCGGEVTFEVFAYELRTEYAELGSLANIRKSEIPEIIEEFKQKLNIEKFQSINYL